MKYIQKDDLKVGQSIYVSHPVYGIDSLTVDSLPYKNKYTGGLFFDVTEHLMGGEVKIKRSVNDSGLNKDSYNYRRTFTNYQDAVKYAASMIKDDGFKNSHARHLELCSLMDDLINCWQ